MAYILEPPQGHTIDYRELLMKTLELFITLIIFIVFAPLLIFLAFVVWLADGGPPLFLHPRIGRGGRTFNCLKFRSMYCDSDRRLARHLEDNPAAQVEWALHQKLRADPRVTVIGRFLRSSSLDELPQLLNVLRGDMSLVGPRPIVRAEAVRYGRWFHDYCAVRPGITGLWQVSGRSEVSYQRRVAMDVLYVRRRCVGLYVMVLLRTVPAVMRRRGAY